MLKIDVEGAELEVLRGASLLLRTGRPVIHIEAGAASREPVTRLLHEAGYVLFDAEAAPGRRRALQTAAWNTIAIWQGEA